MSHTVSQKHKAFQPNGFPPHGWIHKQHDGKAKVPGEFPLWEALRAVAPTDVLGHVSQSSHS